MECVTKCLETVLGPPSEFGPNLTAWSPLSLSQIRSRQEWNEQPESYKIGKDKGAVITLRYGWVCQRGLYPDDPDKENQDSFKIIPSFDGEPKTLLMGVFDGHGEYGDDCSAFVRDSIGDYLAAARKEYKKDLEKSFRASFRKMNSDMHFQTDFSDLLSGTTACVAFFEKSAVWVANVGDSRAIIAKISGGELKGVPLSTDQTPYRKDERDRIRAHGGEIMSADQRSGTVPLHDNWDLDLGCDVDEGGDPPRVWMPNKEKPGCAFTRSIGDAMGERVGVIADPELTKKELKEHDKFVVICSDGVWEFMSNQTVVDIVDQHDDALTACRSVVAEAYRLWLQYDIRTDDITMLLAYIDFKSKKPKVEAPKSRGSIRGSISIGEDLVTNGGARPVRRGLSKAKKGVIAALAQDFDEEVPSIDDLPSEHKTAEELVRIGKALDKHYIFASLTEEQRQKFYQAITKRMTTAGEVVVKSGTQAEACYVVDSGAYLAATGGEETTIKGDQKTPYPLFGELSLLYSRLHTQTISVAQPGVLWVIDRKVFRAVLRMGNLADQTRGRALETLKSISVFRSLTGQQLNKLASALPETTYKEGDCIVNQGDDGSTGMYLITEGHVICKDSDGTHERTLLELKAGSYFGERSLLDKAPRAATVQATKKTVVLNISAVVFEQQLGSLQAIIDNDRRQREMIASMRQQRQRALGVSAVDQGSFQMLALMNEKPFGQFILARLKADKGGQFTLKCVSKLKALSENAAKNVMSEYRIAARLVDEHPFVPSLLHTFESPAYLFSLYDTTMAMDLLSCLGDYGPFDEATALFYAANIFLAIDHLHQNGVVYRNVNPEGIMLQANGYIMLIDLSFAGETDGKTPLTDLCGEFQYLSPEQVSGAGHSFAVDYWALGVLIYEMITERTPWATGSAAHDTEEGFYSRIASHYSGGLNFPEVMSIELVTLLDKLLEPTVHQRLASADAFRSQPWLQVVNWKPLQLMKVPAPHAPEARKYIEEKKAAGTAKCLLDGEYVGDTRWYDGFVMPVAERRTSLATEPATAASGGVASRENSRLPPPATSTPTTPFTPPQPSTKDGLMPEHGAQGGVAGSASGGSASGGKARTPVASPADASSSRKPRSSFFSSRKKKQETL